MVRNILLLLLTIAFLSCNKDGDQDTYIVSARKMIGITGQDWIHSAGELRSKRGYQYTLPADNLSGILKAVVHLPAIDDSNRVVKGAILLNIAPDDRVFHASFDSEPLVKNDAYAMMLNYNHQSLQALTGITASIGEMVQNGLGGNTTVSEVLLKVNSGEAAEQLGVTYTTANARFTMVLFRQADGRYIFSFRGNR